MSREHGQRVAIGAALKDARRRMGMDVKEAEERTKIRARYLRALEAEDWEVLPAPAYVRGFLRAYGQILGLDGEMLADEFRRRYEEPAAAASPASEPLLQERRRGVRSGPPSRGPVIAGVVVLIVLLLAILGLFGGDEGDEGESDRPSQARKADRNDKRGERKRGERGSPGREPIDISIEALSSSQLCLVGGGDSALIDSQVLTEGTFEEFSGERRYRLDLAAGSVRLTAGETEDEIEAIEPVSVEADSNGIEQVDFAGPDCP